MRRHPAAILGLALGLAALFVLLAHPLAVAGSDLWSNVAPASPLGSGGLFNRYPLDHYTLDQHFDAVSVSLTGGVDVSGLLPMIAYFFASLLWLITSFLASWLIELFSWAFSLDLVNGSSATGGAGALAPVSRAIHEIYTNVFGPPWLALAISVAGAWAMWKALVQRRYSETAGALALSLIYIVVALFFVAEPGTTIGTASKWTNQMSVAFLSIADHGEPGGGDQAKDAAADQLFDLLVYKPWTVLEFGGLEHCAVTGTGDEDSDPESAPVRPLSSNPSRDAELARRLATGTEITADGKTCVNNANKYDSHFLHFGLDSDERNAEYDALDHGDSKKLPEADKERAGYRLGVADKPATDAMEEGGQYQRLLIAIVVFVGELGAFLLLGSLSVGIILAQVLLLLLLAFAPVALVAAVIPGRGHAFFKGWLEKLAGYLLRKAAYSLILATLLAVNGAVASATTQLGWLMSFGLQALFFWTVLLQRKALAEGLIGIATGPGAPGREATLRVLALYAGARAGGRVLRPLRRRARSMASAPGRLGGGVFGRRAEHQPGPTGTRRTSRFGTSYSASVGGGYPSMDEPGPAERTQAAAPGSTAPTSASRSGKAGAETKSVAEVTEPKQTPAGDRGPDAATQLPDHGRRNRQGAKDSRRRQGAKAAKRRQGSTALGARGRLAAPSRPTANAENPARPELAKRAPESPVSERGERRARANVERGPGPRPGADQDAAGLGEALKREREEARRVTQARPERKAEGGDAARPPRRRQRWWRKRGGR
jgi:hypothetical protein